MYKRRLYKRVFTENILTDYRLEHIALGEVISSLYTERGYSQQDFAKITGIVDRHLRRIEQGIVDIKIDTLFIIADALDVSLLQLFEEMERVKERLVKLENKDL